MSNHDGNGLNRPSSADVDKTPQQELMARVRQHLEQLRQSEMASVLVDEDLLHNVVDTVRRLRETRGSADIRVIQLISEVAPLFSINVLRKIHVHLVNRRRTVQENSISGLTDEFINEAERFVVALQTAGRFLDINEERDEAQSVLNYWANWLYRSGRIVNDAILEDFDSDFMPLLPNDLCPYVGLEAFREQDAARFFGRHRIVEQLIALLTNHRLVAVIGPSGSGKSSLIRAGLIPALKKGLLPVNDKWLYIQQIVPGRQPLVSLADALQLMPSPGSPPLLSLQQKDPLTDLRIDGRAVITMLSNISERPMLLVIDQFEELFTLCTDENERTQFLAALAALTSSQGTTHRVLLIMRTDFEQYTTRTNKLFPLVEDRKFHLPPMSVSELREAIERPAKAVNLRFETGVVEALLQDIVGEPVALPLLQFTLLKLWGLREGNLISSETYQRVDSGRLALVRAADLLYHSLDLKEQIITRQVLLRMVRLTEGLEVTSNQVRRGDLNGSEDLDQVSRVIDKWVDRGLIRRTQSRNTDDELLELVHEALVQNWPILIEWLEDERFSLRRRQRLSTAAEQWQHLRQDQSALLRGALLEEVRHYNDLTLQEQAFVQASFAAQEVTIRRPERPTVKLKEQEDIAYSRRLGGKANILQPDRVVIRFTRHIYYEDSTIYQAEVRSAPSLLRGGRFRPGLQSRSSASALCLRSVLPLTTAIRSHCLTLSPRPSEKSVT